MSEIEDNTEVLDELESEVSKSSKKPLTSQPMFIYGSLGAIAVVFAIFMYVALGSGNDLPKKKSGWGKEVTKSEETEAPKEVSKKVGQVAVGQSEPQPVGAELQPSIDAPRPANINTEQRKEVVLEPANSADEEYHPKKAPAATQNENQPVSSSEVRDLKTHVDSLQTSNMVVHNDIKEQLKAINEQLERLADTSKSSSSNRSAKNSNTKRLPGFSVISFTSDGKYAVIKAPSSVITLFKGEKFSSHLGTHLVLTINQKESRIEVSKGYFIDGKRIEPPKATTRPKIKKVVSTKGDKDSKKIDSNSTEGYSAFGKEEIEGYKVMAVVEQGNAVILQDRTGSVFRLNLGDKLDGFGSVKHITEEGNVLFINHIIRKI